MLNFDSSSLRTELALVPNWCRMSEGVLQFKRRVIMLQHSIAQLLCRAALMPWRSCQRQTDEWRVHSNQLSTHSWESKTESNLPQLSLLLLWRTCSKWCYLSIGELKCCGEWERSESERVICIQRGYTLHSTLYNLETYSFPSSSWVQISVGGLHLSCRVLPRSHLSVLQCHSGVLMLWRLCLDLVV
jgi:hypothetical protein